MAKGALGAPPNETDHFTGAEGRGEGRGRRVNMQEPSYSRCSPTRRAKSGEGKGVGKRGETYFDSLQLLPAVVLLQATLTFRPRNITGVSFEIVARFPERDKLGERVKKGGGGRNFQPSGASVLLRFSRGKSTGDRANLLSADCAHGPIIFPGTGENRGKPYKYDISVRPLPSLYPGIPV